MGYQNRAIKLVAGKCALAARVDAFREATLGQVGTQLREKILESLAKVQEPPPAKQKKPLVAPDDRARPKRGGKRFRRMKEKYGLTDFKKAINRLNFGPDVEEDVSQESFEMGYGTIKREEGMGYGSIRPHERKQKDTDLKAIKRQRQAAAAGARDGMSSSLAFTPVQGIELANPLAAREKKGMLRRSTSRTRRASSRQDSKLVVQFMQRLRALFARAWATQVHQADHA